MKDSPVLDYIGKVLDNRPKGWLRLTTHRLDIYNEEKAKVEFLDAFEALYQEGNAETSALDALPTAYDYIRLGHPLSCVLEWTIAKQNQLNPKNVICFSSRIMPIMAILRKNTMDGRNTRIVYNGRLPAFFDTDLVKEVYGYVFEVYRIEEDEIPSFGGTTIYINQGDDLFAGSDLHEADIVVNSHEKYGSILMLRGGENAQLISEVQHVRRRESIAMTPQHCLGALNDLRGISTLNAIESYRESNLNTVTGTISEITKSDSQAIVGSSGLSVQYAIAMGLIHHARIVHPGKPIKFVVPPNCYGGTNDQARRVAASIDDVEVVDLPVDGEHNMVQSVDLVLDRIAAEDGVPIIIAEIPTNPRVDVPVLDSLKVALEKPRTTIDGSLAINPIFILDQTFCPNVQFLEPTGILSSIKVISYVSGSKFPSGGLCTAGYAVANQRAATLMDKIHQHLVLCDNEATEHQLETMARQLPTMIDRIAGAYKNTRAFVDFIQEVLPQAKINFVSEELAKKGFTPSVFSLDLPTKGDNPHEREMHKRALNKQLINLMISEIPKESKYCVSYGQLQGCYWTIPATSTQGTTKEGDKDYITRVALSPDMDLDRHKEVFRQFVQSVNG